MITRLGTVSEATVSSFIGELDPKLFWYTSRSHTFNQVCSYNCEYGMSRSPTFKASVDALETACSPLMPGDKVFERCFVVAEKPIDSSGKNTRTLDHKGEAGKDSPSR